MAAIRLTPEDALIVVDVQRDFCAGGALEVPGGDDVVAPLNRWMVAARASGAQVAASRDWHPPDHLSFKDQGGPWPPHCIQDTSGAGFHPDLRVPSGALLVAKGVRYDRDQYSAFDETGLAAVLRARGVRRVWVAGLALDVCVCATAFDAVRAGFETHLLASACRAVSPEDGNKALAEMASAGVVIEHALTPAP